MPDYDPNKIKAPYAYAIRIDNYGRFAHKPKIEMVYPQNATQPMVSISAAPGTVIHYTTDGSKPTENSTLYTQSFSPAVTCTVKAFALAAGSLPSGTTTGQAVKYEWMPAVKASKLQTGVAYKYFEPSGKIDLGSAETNQPVASGITNEISIDKKQRVDKFAFSFEGYIKINTNGIYNFFTISDDGSKLFIDDTEVVNNDGEHGGIEKAGKALLKKGLHKIHIVYFDSGGGNELKVMMQPESGIKQAIPLSMLFHHEP